MTDPMRDQIRSVIATIVEDAGDPVPFEDVRAMTLSRRPTRGPLLAAAVFVAVIVVVGFVALLRPPADTGPVVTEPTTNTTDAGPIREGVGLTTGPVRVGDVPTGLVLEVWDIQPNEDSVVSFGPGTGWVEAGPRPQLTVQTRWRRDQPPLDQQQAVERLQAVHGADAVAEMTVRGRPAVLVERPGRANGWTVAVLVFESDALVSEVQAAGLGVDDVIAAAESLVSVDTDIARQEAVDRIGWELRVMAVPENAEAYRQRLLQVDGVAQVTLRTSWFESRELYFDANSEEPPASTTTSVGTQEEDTDRAFEFVDALVHLDDGSDVETVAVAIIDLGDSSRVGFSPAVATSRTLAFLDQLLSGAELVHDDPPIYQPGPGATPNFDTSDLGDDVPLYPATGDDDFSERIVEAILSPPGFPGLSESEPMAGPFIHLGRLDDGSRLFTAFEGTHPNYRVWHHTETGSSAGTGSLAFYGYGVTGASSGPDGSHVFIAVPLNTAVYTYELTGARYQQQPIGGHGVLPIAATSGTVTAYDQDGNVLGTWQR